MLAFFSHTIFWFNIISMRLLLALPRYCVFREMLAVACEVNGVWHARASLDSKSYLYGIAFSRPACLFYLGAVIDPLHGKKINRIVGCAWNVDALIVRNFREKHWENILQRGNTIYRRESCRREKVAILENSQSPSVVQTGWLGIMERANSSNSSIVWLENAHIK